MDFNDLELSERLLIARRGTAFFAQRLAELTDDELDGDTLLDGWTRKHLLAHVGYNAAALCRLLDWAATGVETPMYESMEQRGQEINEGATLSAAALRNLFDHTVARLDEKWRHLPESAWDAEVRTAQGRSVPASETVWMRTREVWIHAVDLVNGARFTSFPNISAGVTAHRHRRNVAAEGTRRRASDRGGGSRTGDRRERGVRQPPGCARTTRRCGPLGGRPRRHRGVVKRARTRTAALALTVSLKSTAARPAESTNRR